MPSGSVAVVIIGTAAIVRVKFAVAVAAPLSETCTVIGNEPDAVGVPEITPVDAFKVKPAGSEPVVIDHV